MPRPDEGLIHAWLDGELSPEESERVARLVAEDAEWSEAAAEARGLIAASSRILSSLDSVPSGVIPKGSRAAPAVTSIRTSRFTVRPWMKIAAGLVFIAGTTVVLTRDGARTLMEREARIASEDVIAPPPVSETAPTAEGRSAQLDSSAALRREESQRENRSRVVAAGAGASPAVPSSIAPTVAPTVAQAQTPPAPLPARLDVANAPTQQRLADVTVTGLSAAQKAAPANQGSTLGATSAAAPPPSAVVGELAAQDRAGIERASSARAELERAAPRTADLRTRASAAAARDAGFAAKALSVRALDGCWRTTTAAGSDTVLVTPTILRTVGDSLVIAAGSETRPATVVQDGDVLRGEMTNVNGVRAPFRATRAACPPRPDDAASALSPSPRR